MRLVVHAVRMCLLCALVLCGSLLAQTAPGSVHGQITDPSGAVVVKATVMATGSNGETLSTASSNKGSYEIKGLTPGEYRLSVTAKGFSPKTLQVVIAAGTAQAQDIALEIAVAQTDVTVEEDSRTLSTAASANAGAVVLKGKELDVLSDDPDEMAEDLKQLAGPSLGPDGGEMYIDGFSSGTLPPKSSIREVRINSNPLSAQFDRPGFSGRTEIFTKPGSGAFHGQFQINGNDGIFNAVSPILLPETVNPGSHILMYSGNVSGPINKKSSFFLDARRRDNGALNVINAKLPCNIARNFTCITDVGGSQYAKYTQLWANPQVETGLGPRLDYQVSKNNTLSMRYQYNRWSSHNNGLSGPIVPASISPNGLSPVYDNSDYNHQLRIMDTQVLSTSLINETRLQIERSHSETHPLAPGFSRSIQDMFVFGGNTSLPSHSNIQRIELQNYVSMVHGPHSIRFGGRLRTVKSTQYSLGNHYGSYRYLSLDDYNAVTPTSPAGHWYSFSQTIGNPWASISQADAGLYAEDEWRVRSKLTLTYGLRFETQDNIPNNHANFAPRVAVAWQLNQKTVLRAGFGSFYERLNENTVLQVKRSGLNGLRSYSVMYSPTTAITAAGTPEFSQDTLATPATYQITPNYKSPYYEVAGLTLERQVTKSSKLGVDYVLVRGLHQLVGGNFGVTQQINPFTGLHPQEYVYATAGTFKQKVLVASSTLNFKFVSLNARYLNIHADSNASGPSDPQPADPLNLRQDWGRVSIPTHRGIISGSVNLPKGVRLVPMMIVSSGTPYNMTTGVDRNLDGRSNERPYFYPNGCEGMKVGESSNGVYSTTYGCFSAANISGNLVRVPMNYLTTPGMLNVNLSASKSFGFGKKPEQAQAGAAGGRRAGGGSSQKYRLNIAANARNLFNTNNKSGYSGNLKSVNFGKPSSIMSFGPGGNAANRMLEFSASFVFSLLYPPPPRRRDLRLRFFSNTFPRQSCGEESAIKELPNPFSRARHYSGQRDSYPIISCLHLPRQRAGTMRHVAAIAPASASRCPHRFACTSG